MTGIVSFSIDSLLPSPTFELVVLMNARRSDPEAFLMLM